MQGITNAILCKRSENSDQTLPGRCVTGVQFMCPGHQRFGGRRTHDGIWQTSPLSANPLSGRQEIIGAAGSLSGPVPSDLVRSGRSGLVWSDPIHSVGQSRGQNRHVGNHDIGPGIIKPVGCVGFLTGIMAATDKADTFHSG